MLHSWLRFRRELLLLLGASLLVLSLSSRAAPPLPTSIPEYTLKAVLLFKLTRFVYLPDFEEDQSWTLCVLGNNPFGQTLSQLARKESASTPFKVIELQDASSSQSCNLVFIARSEERNLSAVLEKLEEQQAILTVSDISGFAHKGGMIELSLGNRSREGLDIIINRKAAESRGIGFNAQLLRLAILEP